MAGDSVLPEPSLPAKKGVLLVPSVISMTSASTVAHVRVTFSPALTLSLLIVKLDMTGWASLTSSPPQAKAKRVRVDRTECLISERM